MTYYDLGYNAAFENYRISQELTNFEFGRIILEHKERYVIKTPTNEFDAELIGNLRFTAESRYDFPAVGDWVAFSEYDDGKALIHAIYPRFSIIKRCNHVFHTIYWINFNTSKSKYTRSFP